MEIDIKKNKNKELDFLSVEKSDGFNVNRLQGIKNIESTYFLNKANNILTKKTETELKQYFSKNKDELISILKQILEINKNDFKEENHQLLKTLIPKELQRLLNLSEENCVITFSGNVNELPENPETGKIYGLIGEDNKITYHLYLKDGFIVLLDKEYYDDAYYKKNEVNSKILELTLQLNEILEVLESTINNTISKTELNEFISKMNLIQHDINELKAFLNI